MTFFGGRDIMETVVLTGLSLGVIYALAWGLAVAICGFASVVFPGVCHF